MAQQQDADGIMPVPAEPAEAVAAVENQSIEMEIGVCDLKAGDSVQVCVPGFATSVRVVAVRAARCLPI